MNRAFAITLSLLLCGAVSSVHADIPTLPPVPAPGLVVGPQKAKLVVEIDEKAKEPRLQIPQNLILAAPPKKDKGAAALGLPTIVIGLALSAAFVSGGLWLVRRGRAKHVAAAVVALALLTCGGTAVFADLIGPKPKRPVTLPLPAGIQLSENITIEIVPAGDAVKLIVNKDMILGVKDKPEDKKESE